MKFQIKMKIAYIVLGIITAFVAGSIYYSMSMEKIHERESQNLAISAKQLKQQYEEMILAMKDVSYYLLSDADTLEAITAISRMVRTENTNKYFINAENTILSQENNDYLSKKFYRVIFCNDNCAPIANHNLDEKKIRHDLDYKEMPWYEKARSNSDTFTIVGIHEDTWGMGPDRTEVFSVIKEIQGENRGYIEVQMSLADMQERLKIAEEDIKICLLDDEGELLYQNGEVDETFCRNIWRDSEAAGKEEGYLAVKEYSDAAKTMLIVYTKEQSLREAAYPILNMSFVLVGGMLLFSLVYVSVITRYLTKPMIQLQEIIQNTSLETLDPSVKVDFTYGSDEFQQMERVYENMRDRLHKAILHEKSLSTLQLKAQFDMLQAQVNPHFIYNVLNVISSRGILNGDEVICDICDDLAGMLRYSTNTKEKFATLREEIHYLELYFSLLKYRYEYKLEYSVQLDPGIEEQKIPKLVIQQFVENSISHGYMNSSSTMRISVEGYENDGYWYVRVRDNGEGFSPEIQEELEKRMEKLKLDLTSHSHNVEGSIGGMGILNSFARLSLMNENGLVFRLGNLKEGGAEVLIGAAMDSGREEKL